MIKISKQVDYALQLIVELSNLEENSILSLKKFSLKSNISFLFLQKIARFLKQSGIILSAKGKTGGYKLAKPINKISIREVVEAVDGPYGATDCAKSGGGCCNKKTNCSVKKGMEKMNKQIMRYLESETVASMYE